MLLKTLASAVILIIGLAAGYLAGAEARPRTPDPPPLPAAPCLLTATLETPLSLLNTDFTINDLPCHCDPATGLCYVIATPAPAAKARHE